MVLKEKIKATLVGLLIACIILAGIVVANELISGRYRVDSDGFDPVVEYGSEVSLDGIELIDNRTLGLHRFKVEQSMILRIDDTDSTGRKEIVISHGGKEYVVHFEVRYRVDFVAGDVTVDSQLVLSADEVTLPTAPAPAVGYTFSHWDTSALTQLSGNVTVSAVYNEISYPALDGYTATFGDTLGSITLGANEHGYWEFLDPVDTPVGNVGRVEHGVRFVYYSDPTVFKYAYASIQVAKKEYQLGTVVDVFYYDGQPHVPYVQGIETIYAGASNVLPGTYQYTLEIVDENYSGVYTGTYQILKPTVTVTVSSATVTYKDDVPELTFTVEGFENVELLGIRVDTPAYATQVGVYDIGITYTNENVNYIVHKGTLTVLKGDLDVAVPEISEVTFEDKLADVEFLGKYLGTWAWESPETVVDSMDGITAYAIFTHDDPNLNPVRMPITITGVTKKTLYFNVTESTFVYEQGREHSLVYEIVGGIYPELYATLTVFGNEPASVAGSYRRILVINDERYEGSITAELVIDKAMPEVDLTTVYEQVWQENLRLESIALPEGYSWQNPTYRITEAGLGAYNVIYTPADTDNYQTVTGQISVRVAKAPITVAGVLDSYEKTYDTYAFDLATGIAAYYTDGVLTVQYYKNGAPVSEIVNAGEYLLVVTVTEGKNYLGTTITREVTVSPATNVQTVLTEQSAVYQGGVASLVLPESVEGTWSWAESDLGAAGVKTLTAVFTPDERGNYLPREVEVTVNVAKRTLSISDLSLILYYNGEVQTLGADGGELYATLDEGGRDVGSYTAVFTLRDKDNYQWSDGSDTLTVTYSILPSDNAFTYLPEDGLNIPYLSSLSALLATARYGGVRIEYKRVGAPDSEYSEIAPDGVGTYVVRYTTTDTNCTAILTETRTFTVTPIAVVPAPSVADTTIEYNGTKQTAALLDTVDGIYTVTDTGATNAGDIGTVTLTIYNPNYVWSDGSTVLTLTYEIVKGANAWTVEPYIDSEITYGDTPTLRGEAEYDALEVYHRVLGSEADFVLGLPTSVGSYEIRITTSGLNAERAEERFFTLTVSKREVSLPTANRLVYNGTEQIGVAIPGDGLYTVTGGTATLAGRYVAVATLTDPNYKWEGTDSASVEIAYTVAKAQGVITLTKPSYELTYDGTDLFDLIKEASVNNAEQSTVVTYTVISYVKHDGTPVTATTLLGAGSYTVSVSVPETDNYLGATVTLTVTVDKITVTVPTVSDKVYTGSPIDVEIQNNSIFTVGGDLTATDVGEYTVSFTLTDPDNYEWLGTESGATVSRTYKIGTALNGWAKAPESVSAVYNGRPVTVSAEALHGTVTVVYTIGGVVVDAPVGAGVYSVTITAVADNYSELVAYATVTITKATVTVPTPTAPVYNGTAQTLALSGTELYTVVSLSNGTRAGEVLTATLTLTDPTNYKWSTGSDATVTVSATVEKANIVLDGAPVVNNWTFGEAELLPTASVIASQSHFDGLTVELLYSYGNEDNFFTYSELLKTDGKLNAGTYYVKAVVADSSDWDGTESETVTFAVARQSVSVPTALDSVFDGRVHNGGLVSNVLYTVTDEGGTLTGTYYATLTLTDTVNYEWSGDSSVTVSVQYRITKLTFADESVELTGTSVHFGTAPTPSVSVGIYALLDEYITYLYSLDGTSWYDSADALAQSLGGEKLNTGTYLVKTVISESDNWYGYERVDTLTVTKKVITPPTAPALTYNGTEQIAVSASEGYTVVGGSATNVGIYCATLTLTDADNYEWQGTDLVTIEVAYSIAKARNSWAIVPAISSASVSYKDAYTVSGAPLYDTLRIKYKSTSDTEYILITDLSQLPTAVGSYEIVLYTDGTNAGALTATLYLTVTRKTVTKPTALTAPVYDGSVKAHGLVLSDGMTVRSSTTALNAGETVSVTLGLTDSNYVWSDGTTADYTLTATVQKANVTFGTLTVPELVYTELPSPTVSVDQAFASSLVEYVYSQDKVNYLTLAELTAGGYLPAGDYWVKARVVSDNIALSESAPTAFTVKKATPDTISVSWGSSPSNGGLYYQNLLTLNEKGTSVSYNGVKVEALSYTYSIKGSFAGADTVYTVTVTPKDSDNFNVAYIDVTVPLKTVATIGHGGTPYGTIEDAVGAASSGNVVWVVADNTGNVVITTNLVIPSGVTLRLPYGSGSADYNSNRKSTLTYDSNGLDAPAETNPEAHRKTYVVLAAGKRITVNGTLEISGEISGGGYSTTYQDYAGHTARYYALLEMQTGSILDINGTVYALGYIRETEEGKSAVYVNAGGSLNQPFVLRDFRTGNYIKATMGNHEYSPFTRFILMNVSPVTTTYAGGKVVGYANLYAGKMHNHASGVIVGSDSSAFVQLTAGRLVCKYDIDEEVMNLDFYGGAILNEFELSLGLLYGSVSSADFPLAFTYHMNVTLNREVGQTTDAVYTMGRNGEVYKMMPGARLTVGEGTVLNISTINIYDSSFVEDIKKVSASDYSNVLSTIKCYPTDKGDAILTVNGRLVVTNIGGNVHTSSDGATLLVTGTNTVSNKEVTHFFENDLSSGVAYDRTVTNSLKLYYDGRLVRSQTMINVEYTASTSEGTWTFVMPAVVEIQLGDGYGIKTDFAVLTDESGETYIGSFDSSLTRDNPTSIKVLEGSVVTYYLTKNQLLSTSGVASKITVTSADDIHFSDYTKEWIATSTSPVVYNVKAVNLTGTGLTKLSTVSFVYDTATGNVSVTLKSTGSILSSNSFTVNGTKASSSGLISKTYTYTTTVTVDNTTLNVV